MEADIGICIRNASLTDAQAKLQKICKEIDVEVLPIQQYREDCKNVLWFAESFDEVERSGVLRRKDEQPKPTSMKNVERLNR